MISPNLVCIVWLGEGGTLWRAKWTRRGQKEPHPSITRVDKGGLHNKKAGCALSNFFRDAWRRGRSPAPSGEWSSVLCRAPVAGFPFDISFPSKVAAAVGASALKLEHKAGESRARDIGNEERASERSGPLFLCLMRGALRGQLEGMLWHAPPQRTGRISVNTWNYLSVSFTTGESLYWCWFFFFFSLVMLWRARQSICLPKVCK